MPFQKKKKGEKKKKGSKKEYRRELQMLRCLFVGYGRAAALPGGALLPGRDAEDCRECFW